MSFHKQNLEAFIALLTDKRSRRLFTEKNLADLAQIVAPLPDDLEKLSIAIATWYENHPPILDAQLDILNDLLSPPVSSAQTVNLLAFERATKTPKATTVKPPQLEINKQTLQNAIAPLDRTKGDRS